MSTKLPLASAEAVPSDSAQRTNINDNAANQNSQYPPSIVQTNYMSYTFVKDPLTELSDSTGALINQEPAYLESDGQCSSANVYHVFIQSPNSGLKYAFKCNEISTCCARFWCSADTRPLTMDIKHISSAQEFNADLAKTYFNIERPCMCPCLCFCRPYMEIRNLDTDKKFGKIRHPCKFCGSAFEVINEENTVTYTIEAGCCEAGLCCCGKCAKTSNVQFKIMQDGNQNGLITKSPSKGYEKYTNADSYTVQFPGKATPEEKMLLIVAALMIDYQYFEKEVDDEDCGPSGVCAPVHP